MPRSKFELQRAQHLASVSLSGSLRESTTSETAGLVPFCTSTNGSCARARQPSNFLIRPNESSRRKAVKFAGPENTCPESSTMLSSTRRSSLRENATPVSGTPVAELRLERNCANIFVISSRASPGIIWKSFVASGGAVSCNRRSAFASAKTGYCVSSKQPDPSVPQTPVSDVSNSTETSV